MRRERGRRLEGDEKETGERRERKGRAEVSKCGRTMFAHTFLSTTSQASFRRPLSFDMI